MLRTSSERLIREASEQKKSKKMKKQHQQANHWVRPSAQLELGEVQSKATNINRSGRHPSGSSRGFGQLWQKTYRLPLAGIEIKPEAVVADWKKNFTTYWPGKNRFHGSAEGVAPGEVVILDLTRQSGRRVKTGIQVIDSDKQSFSFMWLQGQMFVGLITFHAEKNDGLTWVQIQALVRAGDPIFEIGCRLGFGHKADAAFWQGTLQNLRKAMVAEFRPVQQKTQLVDPRIQWQQAGNVWHNSTIRTMLGLPYQLVQKL